MGKIDDMMKELMSDPHPSMEKLNAAMEELNRVFERDSIRRRSLAGLMETLVHPFPQRDSHPLAGKTVRTKYDQEVLVEDWFEKVIGTPFLLTEMNRPGFILYTLRILEFQVPMDNNVVCVKSISEFGFGSSGLLHDSELIYERKEAKCSESSVPPG
ncbi:MAG: hypothetical protein PHD09_03905 [Candidatus Omnitrophica bacterium]|jgi:hypothetical protein|nr:hypothetical protein [Candidatus Omnitrophota bacterium]